MVINNSYYNNTAPSICIPHTLNNTNWLFVKNTFENLLNSKCVRRIDIINKKNKNNITYNCIFIHLIEWPSTDSAIHVRKKLLNGENINVVYNFPMYWKCYASKY